VLFITALVSKQRDIFTSGRSLNKTSTDNFVKLDDLLFSKSYVDEHDCDIIEDVVDTHLIHLSSNTFNLNTLLSSIDRTIIRIHEVHILLEIYEPQSIL